MFEILWGTQNRQIHRHRKELWAARGWGKR